MSNESVRCVPGEAMDTRLHLPVAVRIAAAFQIVLLVIAAIQAILTALLTGFVLVLLLGTAVAEGPDLAAFGIMALWLVFLAMTVSAVWLHFVLACGLLRLRRRAIVTTLIVSLVYAVGIVLSHAYDLFPIGVYFPILPWGIVPLLPLNVTLPILLGANALTLPYWKRAD